MTALDEEIESALFAIQTLKEPSAKEIILTLSGEICRVYSENQKILIAGNGGSLCDALHFAEELTGYFRKERPAIGAIALGDPGHLTCVGNDQGFDQVFARGVEALGQPGDLFIALTTSGNSKNLVLALEQAKKKGLYTLSLLGKGGGALQGRSDWEWIVPYLETTDRIQEVHMALLHLAISEAERVLFHPEPAEAQAR